MGIDISRRINEPLEKSWNPTFGKRLLVKVMGEDD
jgi:hypothetical protein